MTADRRLRVGGWAALAAAFLGPPTILVLIRIVRSSDDLITIGLLIGAAQVIALLVAVIGLRELLEYLSAAAARVVLALGVVGCVADLVAFVIRILDPAGGPPDVVPLVGRALIGIWLIGIAVAVGRGNGGRTATIGSIAGAGIVLIMVAAGTGILGSGGGPSLTSWSLIIGFVEVAFLVLLWRFVLAALQPEPGPI